MVNVSNNMLERIPPQNIEAEQATLGAMLLEREAIARAVELLRAEDFYREAHRLIFTGVIDLFNRNEPVDMITLGEWLRGHNQLETIGGTLYLTTMMSQVPAASGIGHYAGIVREKSLQRQLIRAADEIMTAAYQGEQELNALVDQSEQKIFAIAERNLSNGFVDLTSLVKKQFYDIEESKESGFVGAGLNTYFTELDAITAGLQPSDLVILAARPSMGKTALALNIARNVALKEQKTVALFSLEMSKEQLALRLLCSEARVKQDDVRHAFVDDDGLSRLAHAVEQLWNCPVFIDDTPSISVLEIRGKARRLKAEHGLGLIVIDYLQLMNGSARAENRVQEIAVIARGLKGLARELKVPVIALSQLSRMVESRSPRRPQLSDLRECVTGDTLVQLADGRRLPIRDLEGSTPEVWAVTPEGQLVTAYSDKVWKVGRRQTMCVCLASGRSIQATPEHRLYTLDGWTTVSQMQIGDRLAIPRVLPEPQQTETWSDDRVSLLGHLIGDGSYLVHQPLRYTTASEENSEIVSRSAQREFNATVTRYAGRGQWHQLLLSGNGNRWHPAGVGQWLKELGIFGQRSHEKRIPDSAFQLGNRQIALLLQHLWATDGTIFPRVLGRGGHSIAFSTNSVGLANDVAALLLRLGIVARICQIAQGKYRPVYSVMVSGAVDQQHFLQEVGAFGTRIPPAQRLSLILANTSSNTNVDTLPPEIFRRVRSDMREQGISQRRMAELRGTSYGGTSHFKFSPSRAVVTEYAAILNDDILLQQATNDLYWDRIVALEPAGEEEVYDLTVPGLSCWIANGIVSHNSGAIEQDADLVLFLYRPDYYGEEELKKIGWDPERDRNVVEMIVAKQRNGPTGTIKLVWMGEFGQFGDMAQYRERG